MRRKKKEERNECSKEWEKVAKTLEEDSMTGKGGKGGWASPEEREKNFQRRQRRD